MARDSEAWFAGRTAIVTGAARGIGRGIGELLEELGALVVAVDNDAEALTDAWRGRRGVPWPADVAADDPDQLAEEIWRAHGPVPLIVNNVGIDTRRRFLELDPADFDLVFTTNLRGPWFLTRAIVRRLVDAGLGGSIVFVSSLHDSFVRTLPHYSASKAAVAMLVREAANELAPYGIRVNAVSPGQVRTARNPIATREAQEQTSRVVPLGRPGEPADVARMVAVLLSDDWAGYVTGENVRVDGGLGLHSWSIDERERSVARPRLLRGLGRRR